MRKPKLLAEIARLKGELRKAEWARDNAFDRNNYLAGQVAGAEYDKKELIGHILELCRVISEFPSGMRLWMLNLPVLETFSKECHNTMTIKVHIQKYFNELVGCIDRGVMDLVAEKQRLVRREQLK